jgi:hypothetical protein
MKKVKIGKFQEYISENNFRVLVKYPSALYQYATTECIEEGASIS